MFDSLRSHESQHARPPCPSPTPGVHSNSCPSSRQCHPAISYSVVPFSCPQSLPASGSFPMSQLFALGGQSIGVSVLASVLPVNTQDWSPFRFMDLTFQVPMQYCSLQYQILLPSTVTSTIRFCFCFGSVSSLFLELLLHWSPVAYWTPTDLGSSSFHVLSFCLFIVFMGFSRQEYWFAIPFSSGPHFVRTAHKDPSILSGSTWHGS